MKPAIHRKPSLDMIEFYGMVTVAPQMRAFFELMERISRREASILIRGESGTGKELVAQAIHKLSKRSRGPFRAINCAVLTPELLASELFGHVRGAFTGAIKDRRGLFSLAHRGTIFLDEIAEMPLELQARLLRVIQEQRFVPVGGTEPVQVDVRVVSATHKALREAVAEKTFREDLMYRIRVVPIFLPRLVEREGDIEALLWHFIEQLSARDEERRIDGVDAQALEAMLSYPWPGNIRELSNAVEHAFAVGIGPVITLADLPPELRGEPPRSSAAPQTARDVERQGLLDALREARGRKGAAAEILGISRSTLWRKLREHRID